MRFQHKGRGIDMVKTEEQIMAAIESGVNYFDTAYIYPGSEEALGEILEKNHARDRVNIATKLPHYMIKKTEDLERYFQEQLQRLRTDHIDYYRMHMLPEVTTWNRLKSLGIEEWLAQKVESGAIRNVGFSNHGSSTTFCELLDAYDWDFCQFQYNYIDEFTQAGRRGMEHAAAKGIPIVIMEPLRGGRLVNLLPEKAVKRFKAANPDRSPAEWGLRWLWNQPEITVVLSGMNSMEMVQENCRIASEVQAYELTDEDFQVYADVIAEINRKIKVGCTGCGYCMPCPRGVDIPGCFRAYNERYSEGFYTGMKEYFMCTTLRSKPSCASLCVQCGRCEQHCPQHIHIREELKNVKRVMENPAYQVLKLGAKVLGRF
jgi:predicted aldo/keto reductase-like oxidoreductase